MANWQGILVEPTKTILSQAGRFLSSVLLVVVILIIGWFISKLVRTLVTKGLKAIRVDELSKRIALDNILARGGISYSFSELIGVICYWLGLLVTVVVAINAVGLTIAADLLKRVVLYIPNIIAAIFILVLGMFVATLLRNIVQTTAANAGLAQANLLGKIVEFIVIIFAIAITLEQLNIGTDVVKLIVSILLGSIGLGIALAFGLGCKDIAARFISDLIEKLMKK